VAVPRAILIHGSGGDHRGWALQSPRFPGSVAVDLPGHPDGTALDHLDGLVATLTGALERVEGPRALVGHSLGGAAALATGLARPDLVDGIVVVGAGARLPVPDSAIERLDADFGAERERLVEGSVTDAGSPAARRAREAIDACGPAGLAADYAACRSVDLRGKLAALSVPVLLVHGADDHLVPVWLGEELARELPMAQMVVVPGARHAPMSDAPGTVDLLLAAYLARLELTLEEAG
jgi:pimeloyl-ACP methyl ester carboxylesterase